MRFRCPYCEFISLLHAPAYFSGHRIVVNDILRLAYLTKFFFYFEQQSPVGPGPPHCRYFTITLR